MDDLTKEHIRGLCNKIQNELISKQDRKDFGTTIDETLGHDYEKFLMKHFQRLKEEFNQIDINQDEEITFNELLSFFQNKNSNITEDDLKKIFELFDRDQNEKITIEEFIYAYIKLEEQLKIKQSKLKNVRENLIDEKKNYEKKRLNYENEIMNGEISENSELLIQLIEGINLNSNSNNIINAKVEFNQISNENIIKKSVSRLINSNNPKFKQDFLFKIYTPYDSIIIKVSDQGSYYDNLLGTININLNKYKDQIKKDERINIINEDEPNKINGILHFKIRYRHNFKEYFNNLIYKTDAQIKRLDEVLIELNDYLQKINEPFGLIIANKANDIIQEKILEKSEDPREYIESWRRSVYISPGMLGHSLNFNKDKNNNYINNNISTSNIKNDNNNNKINYDNLKNIKNFNERKSGRETSTKRDIGNLEKIDEFPEQNSFQKDDNILDTSKTKLKGFNKKNNSELFNFLMYFLGLVLSILNCFGKNVFVNVGVFFFGILNIYNSEKNDNINQYFFYLIYLSFFTDFFWLFFGKNVDGSTFFNFFSSLFTIINICIKVALIYFKNNKK